MKKLSVFLAFVLILSVLTGCTVQDKPSGFKPSVPEKPTETAAPASDNETPAPTEAPAIPENSFRFTRDNFPRLDGSTSLVPLAEAVCCVLLGENREDVTDLVQFNRTTQSYRNLMYGQCGLLLASVPNAKVYDELEENGFAIESEEICTEALVFLVNENNPVDSLTTEQVRDIYAGRITNWKEVGGNDEEIVAFQRNEGAGSQALIKKLVMGDTEMMQAPEDFVIESMGGLMESVKSYDNSANALGYSVYYYAHDMEMAQGLKLLRIDGVEPNKETIRARECPHLSSYYCVIPATAEKDSPSRILFDWLMTDEGQRLIAAEGYVSVRDVG